jgi:hypothetical protein
MTNRFVEFVREKLNEGYIAIKLDYHSARRTDAKTCWLKPEDYIYIISNYTPEKTHWKEYYLTKPQTKWLRVRRTNRGNWHTRVYEAKDLKISDQELEELLVLLET